MTPNPYTAIYLMTDEHLLEETAQLQLRIRELLEERDKRASWTPEFRLSIKLHDAFCRHKDCDFNYQFGPSGQTDPKVIAEPSQYFDMANELMTHFGKEQVEYFMLVLSRYRL